MNKEVLPLHTDVMAKHILNYQGRLEFIQNILEAKYKVSKGTYDGLKILDKNSVFGEYLEENSKYLERCVLVELPTKDIVYIEFFNKFDNSDLSKSFMDTAIIFPHFIEIDDDYKVTKLNFVKENLAYSNPDNHLVCEYSFVNEKDPEDKLFEGVLQIYVVDADVTRRVGYDFDNEFERWNAFIAAETKEEMEQIVKDHEIMEEVFKEMERFSEELNKLK